MEQMYIYLLEQLKLVLLILQLEQLYFLKIINKVINKKKLRI